MDLRDRKLSRPGKCLRYCGPLLLEGSRCQAEQGRKMQIFPHTQLWTALENSMVCATGCFSGLSYFIHRLTVSKLYFQNTILQWNHKITDLKGNIDAILWAPIRTPLSEQLLLGRIHNCQTNLHLLLKSFRDLTISLKGSSFPVLLLCLFFPNWWDCSNRLQSVKKKKNSKE